MANTRFNVGRATSLSAYYPIAASDWGILAPGTTGTAFSASNLAASTTGGSLPTSTGAFKVTYVTALGETTGSVEATVAVTGPTGSVVVTVPVNPQVSGNPEFLAQKIVGWNVYSGSGSGNEVQNITSAGLNGQVLSTITDQNGRSVLYIPIATTTATVQVYGTGSATPAVNYSGIQPPLPNIAASASSDVFLVVHNGFQVQKEVEYMRPGSSADAGGLAPAVYDCVNPLWAASTAFSAGAIITMGVVAFQASVGGTTGSTVPAAFPTTRTKGQTITDGTVTWTCLGNAQVVRLRFTNTTGSAGQPIAQEYSLWQP